jgi:tRNA dimethylallyltransferase
MLYYKALTQGLNDLPAADPATRAELDRQAALAGWPALHARLAEVDPVTAARLAPNDAQRIQRALEIWLLTGTPMSAQLTPQRAQHGTPGRPETHTPPYRFVPVSLEPSVRAVLHERIATRFDAMLAGGLIDEVMQLRARGDLQPELPSMRCVGYRQVWEYLDGAGDWATMRDKGVFATRQLCKRQLTWLRALPGRRVVDCCAADATQQAVAAVLAVWDGAAAVDLPVRP